MPSNKLTFLAQYLRSRAGAEGFCEPEPLSPAEMCNIADAIDGLLPQVKAMEQAPIPLKLRLVTSAKPGRDTF